jgi:hypothetical protein
MPLPCETAGGRYEEITYTGYSAGIPAERLLCCNMICSLDIPPISPSLALPPSPHPLSLSLSLSLSRTHSLLLAHLSILQPLCGSE